MNVTRPADPARADECGATLWARLENGDELFLVQQIYNVAIRRTAAGNHPLTWDEQW